MTYSMRDFILTKARPGMKIKMDGVVTWKILSVGTDYFLTSEGILYNLYSGKDVEIIEDVPVTWDNLRIGDVIVSKFTFDRSILEIGISGKTFLLSTTEDKSKALGWATIEEMKKFGCAPKQPQDNEIIKAMDVLTKAGKIKDGKIIE